MTDSRSDRVAEVEAFMGVVERWAEGRADIEAVALVGSWGRGGATDHSDVDLVVITTAPARYLDDTEWISTFPGARLIRQRSFGMVDERRLLMPTGLEIEVGVTTPEWVTTGHLDEGTSAVVRAGLRIIYDPRGMLRALVAREAAGHGDTGS